MFNQMGERTSPITYVLLFINNNVQYFQGIPAFFGDICAPQVRIGKYRLVKDRIVQYSIGKVSKGQGRLAKEEEKKPEDKEKKD